MQQVVVFSKLDPSLACFKIRKEFLGFRYMCKELFGRCSQPNLLQQFLRKIAYA